MIAYDLPDTKLRDKVFDKCIAENLLVLKSGIKSIRFRPPLNLSNDEADLGIEIIKKLLRTLF